MDKLKKELDQTKKDALKLAKENQRLQKQMATQQAKPATPKAAQKAAPKKSESALVAAPANRGPYRALPSRPVMPDRASAQQETQTGTLETWCFD